MRIGIPAETDEGLDSPVGAHFGRAPFYALVDSETLDCRLVENESSHRGGTQLPPEWLRGLGVEALLCCGLGQRAIMLFEQCSIPVYLGSERTVRGMVEAYLANRMRPATLADGCAH